MAGLSFLKEEDPTVACLQKVKLNMELLSNLVNLLGYLAAVSLDNENRVRGGSPVEGAVGG